MPKKHQKQVPPSDQDEQPQDVLAWGNKKQNYYRQGDQQYSHSSEEEQQAQDMYQRQLDQWGKEDVYQLPEVSEEGEQAASEEEEQESNENPLSHSYLTRQISKMAQLGIKVSEEVDSKVRRVLQTQIQAYLMALISLRDLSIPYIQYHPLFNKTLQMKQEISQLQILLSTSAQESQSIQAEQQFDVQNSAAEDLSEDEGDARQTYSSNKGRKQTPGNIQAGLELYQQVKKQHKIAKSNLKEEKRKEMMEKKRPAFLQVKGNEGRLASEKILKNKGLLKKRKKIDRNGRVKHRNKHKKAMIKHRAKGHIIRQNPGRQYEGERNIRQTRIASTKLK